MADVRELHTYTTNRVDLRELPPGAFVEIKTKNSTYTLAILNATVFDGDYADGLVVTSTRAGSWGHPLDISVPRIQEVGFILSILNREQKWIVPTSEIASITVTL